MLDLASSGGRAGGFAYLFSGLGTLFHGARMIMSIAFLRGKVRMSIVPCDRIILGPRFKLWAHGGRMGVGL